MEILVEVWVVDGEHSTALLHLLLVRVDSLRDELQLVSGQGLVLDTHREHQGVVRHNLTVVKNHVLI